MIKQTKIKVTKDPSKIDIGKTIRGNLRKSKKRKVILKRRVSVIHEGCEKRKKQQNDRAKYGTCSCDSYSFHWSVGCILANSLFQYLADAECVIVRDDWKIIEKHAQAIMDFAEADSWDLCDKEMSVRNKYLEKERNWRKAMFWLTENWDSLWW